MDSTYPTPPPRSRFIDIARIVLLTAIAVSIALLPTLGRAQAALDSNGDGQVNCDDFPDQAAAQAALDGDPGDPYGLDGVVGPSTTGQPGVACESFFAGSSDDAAQDTTSSGKKSRTNQNASVVPAIVPSSAAEPTPAEAAPAESAPAESAPGESPPASDLPADVAAQVEGCAVISISARDIAAAGCPGVGVVIIHLPDSAPAMAGQVIITPRQPFATNPGTAPAAANSTGNTGRDRSPATGKTDNSADTSSGKNRSGASSSGKNSSDTSSNDKENTNKGKNKKGKGGKKHKKNDKKNDNKNGKKNDDKNGKKHSKK